MIEIKVFETYEDVDNQLLKPYAGANDKPWDENNERIDSFRRNYLGNELYPLPADLGKGLEFVCTIELFAAIQNQRRTYSFEDKLLPLSPDVCRQYCSIQELSEGIKNIIQKEEKRFLGVKITPLIYTVNDTANGHPDFEMPIGLKIECLREAEIKEFEKYFFTE